MKKILVTISLAFSLAIAYGQTAYDGRKLSAYLVNMVKGETFGPNKRTAQVSGKVCTLMKLNDASDISAIADEYQCQMLDNIGDIYIMQIPVNQLGILSFDNRVERIEAHEMPRSTMNQVPDRIGANCVWKGGANSNFVPYTGKGVISGIVDFGFDFRHPMFLDSTGVTRVSQFFDMRQKTEDGILGIIYPKDSVIQMQFSPLALEEYHGTNVASAMAGSRVFGERNSYSGIAPESEIVMAEIGMQMTGCFTKGGDFFMTGDLLNEPDGTTANLLLAIKKIFDYADAQGKPCVVNFSGGIIMPLFDPCILEEEAIKTLQGPGRIIVASAGNDGRSYSTMKKTKDDAIVVAKLSAYGNLSVKIGDKSVESLPECYLKTEYSQNVKFIFSNSSSRDSTILETLSICTDTLDRMNGDTCYVYGTVNDTTKVCLRGIRLTDIPMYQFNIYMEYGEWFGRNLPWGTNYIIKVLVESDYPCEMYTYPLLNPFLKTFNPYTGEESDCLSNQHTIAWPAASENVLAVGAITSRNQYYDQINREQIAYNCEIDRIAPFSSQGPTWDGRQKPDVLAPGVYVAVAACGSTPKMKYKQFRMAGFDHIRTELGPEYITMQSGTSIASPIVAGVIALWLQAKPDLTLREIKDILSAIAYERESNYMRYGNNYSDRPYEIDAYAGLVKVLGLPSAISELSMNQPTVVRFHLEGRRLSLVYSDSDKQYDGDATLNIYTMDGRKVAATKGTSIDLSSLNSGVYAVQLNSNQKGCTGSTLIRL